MDQIARDIALFNPLGQIAGVLRIKRAIKVCQQGAKSQAHKSVSKK
jgi:hypothetical protein